MEEEMRLINGVNERNDSWVVEINDRVSKMGSIPKTEPLIDKKNAIYRRPDNVREEKDTFFYTPRVVAFGPYRHDEKTKKSKELALVHCLKRSSKTLDDYLNALGEIVQDLKDAYHQLDPRWQQDDDAFLQLMIYDGCFLLEILHEAESLDASNHLGHLSRQILAMYHISQKELMEYYKHDILLLENQLPMLLLVKLVSVQKDLKVEPAKKDLYERILRFIAPGSSPNIVDKLQKNDPKHMYLHILDLYRHSLLCEEHGGESTPQTSEQVTSESSLNSDDEDDPPCVAYCCICIILIPIMVIVVPIGFIIGLIMGIIIGPLQAIRYLFRSKPATDIYFIIPSATELDKVGIGIKKNRAKSLMNISFVSRTLRLPEIYVDGASQSRFLNIIAFEQLHEDAENEVTSYIYFMSRLLQAGGDVRLLQVRGIIHTPLHNNQVAELFKSLTKDIVHDPEYFLVQNYREVGDRLTTSFYGKMNNPWQRDLWQTYLKSPWAVISVVAAFFLFALTSIQTVYAVVSYYSPK